MRLAASAALRAAWPTRFDLGAASSATSSLAAETSLVWLVGARRPWSATTGDDGRPSGSSATDCSEISPISSCSDSSRLLNASATLPSAPGGDLGADGQVAVGGVGDDGQQLDDVVLKLACSRVGPLADTVWTKSNDSPTCPSSSWAAIWKRPSAILAGALDGGAEALGDVPDDEERQRQREGEEEHAEDDRARQGGPAARSHGGRARQQDLRLLILNLLEAVDLGRHVVPPRHGVDAEGRAARLFDGELLEGRHLLQRGIGELVVVFAQDLRRRVELEDVDIGGGGRHHRGDGEELSLAEMIGVEHASTGWRARCPSSPWRARTPGSRAPRGQGQRRGPPRRLRRRLEQEAVGVGVELMASLASIWRLCARPRISGSLWSQAVALARPAAAESPGRPRW